MNESSLDMLSAESLARLLDLQSPIAWSAADAAAALAHQLAAPLLPDVAQAPGAEAERVARHAAGYGSLQEALGAPAVPLDLLQDIKHWARGLRNTPESPLAGGPATVLYFAAIAAAWVRHGTRISTLPNDQLRAGFAWAAEQAGADCLKGLFEAGAARLPAA